MAENFVILPLIFCRHEAAMPVLKGYRVSSKSAVSDTLGKDYDFQKQKLKKEQSESDCSERKFLPKRRQSYFGL